MEKGNFKREEYNYDDNSQLLPLAKAGDEVAMNKTYRNEPSACIFIK